MTKLFMQDPVQVAMQKEIDRLRQRVAELEGENAELKHILRKIVDRVQGLQPIVLAAMQLNAAKDAPNS